MTRRLEFKGTEGGKSFIRGKTKKTRKERPVPLRDLPQSGEDVLRAQRKMRKGGGGAGGGVQARFTRRKGDGG